MHLLSVQQVRETAAEQLIIATALLTIHSIAIYPMDTASVFPGTELLFGVIMHIIGVTTQQKHRFAQAEVAVLGVVLADLQLNIAQMLTNALAIALWIAITM